MPPGDRAKLTSAQVEILRRWIAAGARTQAEEKPIVERADEHLSSEDRAHWAFQPVSKPDVPAFGPEDRARGPIDAFLAARLRAKGLRMSPDAERETLVRRTSFDLLGLPPTPEEIDRFLGDDSPDAYERLVDRLLASPRLGERWGRHWLDAAGYSDSDGANDTDAERPDAWRYRDYVIASLNADKPYDQFLCEQMAGDELAGFPSCELTAERVELITATGFLRNAADGTGQSPADPRAARNQVIADTLGIVGSGVLGLTIACAQCHDHRYDPIPQKDYHRLRAAFEPAYNLDDWKPPAARRVSLYTDADRKRAQEVEAQAGARRSERNVKQTELVRAVVDRLVKEKVPEEERAQALAAFETPADKRTAEQRALFEKHPFLKISGGTLYQYDPEADKLVKGLDAEIEKLAATRPREDFVRALWEEPGKVPPSRLLIRGQHDQPADEVPPGVPAVLAPEGAPCELEPAGVERTTGRRLALARWIASPSNPLTARVLANRVWMHHFGRGIVPTPGDFGRQGDAPTHPELLDWLAGELVRGGWSLKRLHRGILCSTAYRQSAVKSPLGEERDPENTLYWRRLLVRLEGEAVRDAILAASGGLSLKAGGPPVPVKEDADGSIVVGVDRKGESNRPGEDVPIGAEGLRRSIYVQSRRSRPLSFTSTFDVPVLETNCTRRPVSIAPMQALTLLNGPFVLAEAERFARRVEREASEPAARVALAYRLAFGRLPAPAETEAALAFVEAEAPEHAWKRLCHVLLNTSEMIYVE